MKNLKKQSCVKIVANVFITVVLLMSFSCTPKELEDESLDMGNDQITKTTGEDKGQETKDDED